jgi:hypothetical protein
VAGIRDNDQINDAYQNVPTIPRTTTGTSTASGGSTRAGKAIASYNH